jgi:hypothetical protein
LSLNSASGTQTAVLVVRLWREGAVETCFRGRITACHDIARAGHEMVVVGSIDEAQEFVTGWLARLAASN